MLSEALFQGRVHGKDTNTLEAASQTSLQEKAISPVHMVWGSESRSNRFSALPRFMLDRVALRQENRQRGLPGNIKNDGMEELFAGLR